MYKMWFMFIYMPIKYKTKGYYRKGVWEVMENVTGPFIHTKNTKEKIKKSEYWQMIKVMILLSNVLFNMGYYIFLRK